LNSRFAYVSISRARFEAKIYTNDAQAIGLELSREISKRTAIGYQQEQVQGQRGQELRKQKQSVGLGFAL
jgi:hypothetical protein